MPIFLSFFAFAKLAIILRVHPKLVCFVVQHFVTTNGFKDRVPFLSPNGGLLRLIVLSVARKSSVL